jgi:ABC-type transport system involved in multi-copper enzyme maturation permease subunit
MLGTLIRKEILNAIFSFRFMMTFLLLVIIILATSVILTNDYVRQQDEFSRRQSELESYLRQYAHFNRIGGVIAPAQPPLAFYTLIRGISQEVNMDEFNNDPLPVVFPLIDMSFVVTVLLSLVALLFSYDSICGEKEEGTLKLMFSNTLSRSKLLLGKAIGGTLTLLIPFVFAMGLSLLVILLNPRISWKGSDWGALALILFSTVLYVVLFYCLGLYVSSRHKSGASSILTSLVIWVIFVLVVPSLSPYMASFLTKTPSRIQIEREVDRIGDVERDELGNKLAEEKRKQVNKKYPVLSEKMTKEEIQRRIAADPEYKKAYEELVSETSAAWDEANRIQGEKMQLLWEEMGRKEEQQTRLAVLLSMTSPLSSFTYLASDLSGTGMRSLRHFGNLREGWNAVYTEYERNKISELREKDPTKDVWNSPVDVSDMPRFRFRDEPLLDRLKGTLPFFAVLFVFNILFFAAAFFSFVRYDVR